MSLNISFKRRHHALLIYPWNHPYQISLPGGHLSIKDTKLLSQIGQTLTSVISIEDNVSQYQSFCQWCP
jgi:hypothetical protein